MRDSRISLALIRATILLLKLLHSRASGNPGAAVIGHGSPLSRGRTDGIASTGSHHALALRCPRGRRSEGGDVGRTSTRARALRAGGAQPHRTGRGLVSLRQARRGAEIRHALAVRDGARAPRAELPLAGNYRADDRGKFRRLHPLRRFRDWRGAPVLLVPVVGNGGDAPLCAALPDTPIGA